MHIQKKVKVVLRSKDARTIRDLRGVMASWCDLISVHDLRAIENVCNEHPRERSVPMALIVDSPAATDELTDFLQAVRQQYPTMRRLLIADEDDLSIAIKGLHSCAIDSLLHRPFNVAGVVRALRASKQSGTALVQKVTGEEAPATSISRRPSAVGHQRD